MTFLDLISEKRLTVYKICKASKLPLTTLQDISSGKTLLLNCSGRTLLGLSKVLNVSIEELLSLEPEEDKNLFPPFLSHSIDSLRKAVRTESTLIDCAYDELASSINVAEIEQCITHEMADRLRKRYFALD
ncbi:MAG: helix-turn-helix domain-containing protein [Bacilli bacterium]|nr:helix-turn-helix domain-containing protein [Bacilli bacterium]